MSAKVLLPGMVLLLAGAPGLFGCEPPPVVPSADVQQHSEAARIEGTVVVASAARGDVVLSLFSADRPPPPEGTGRPLSFTFIPEAELFGDAQGDPSRTGPFTAPFAFSLVPEGRYLIKGFLDRDGCIPQAGCRAPDFNPWFGVTNEPNSFDLGGADVDAATLKIRTLEIGRDADGRLRPITDAAVSFADSALIPLDRPVFKVVGAPQLDLSKPFTLLQLQSEKIEALGITSPAFLARWVDDDRDGVPDDANGDGLPEFWPKVFVRKLADGPVPLLDENDLNHDGVIDPEGADYARMDGKKDGLPDAVVLAAGFRPDPVVAALSNPDGSPKMTPVPLTSLDLVIRPLALDAREPKKPAPLQAVPPGRYAVIVMQLTGQTWRVPNELQPAYAHAAGLPEVESQGFVLEVK